MDLRQALEAYDKVLAGWIVQIMALQNLTDAQEAQLQDILKERTGVLNAIDALNAGRIAVAAEDAQAAAASIQDINAGLNRIQGTIAEAQMLLDATNKVLGVINSLSRVPAFL